MKFIRFQPFPEHFKTGNFSIVAKLKINSALRQINAIDAPDEINATHIIYFDIRSKRFIKPTATANYFNGFQFVTLSDGHKLRTVNAKFLKIIQSKLVSFFFARHTDRLLATFHFSRGIFIENISISWYDA